MYERFDGPQQPWNGELTHQPGGNRSALFCDLGMLPIDLAWMIPGRPVPRLNNERISWKAFYTRFETGGLRQPRCFWPSERPDYLYLHNSKVELKDAKHVWGKSGTKC